MASTLPPGEPFALDGLVTPTAQGIASRVLARTAAGNITLFAFDAGEELSEHTAPLEWRDHSKRLHAITLISAFYAAHLPSGFRESCRR